MKVFFFRVWRKWDVKGGVETKGRGDAMNNSALECTGGKKQREERVCMYVKYIFFFGSPRLIPRAYIERNVINSGLY